MNLSPVFGPLYHSEVVPRAHCTTCLPGYGGHRIKVQTTALHHCTVQHCCSTPHSTALHQCTRCTALHHTAAVHCIMLQRTAPHCTISLHHTATLSAATYSTASYAPTPHLTCRCTSAPEALLDQWCWCTKALKLHHGTALLVNQLFQL